MDDACGDARRVRRVRRAPIHGSTRPRAGSALRAAAANLLATAAALRAPAANLLATAALLLAGPLGCGQRAPETDAGAAKPPAWAEAATWAADPLWDDGLAEVATYDARRARYGKERLYTAHLITVKEDLNAALHVKADPPYDSKELLPVLKLNVAEVMPTDNYDYHVLTTVLARRDRVDRAHKMTVGMHEWCGNTFLEYMGWALAPRLHYHSYFDGQGDGEWSLGPGLLDEQLPLSLRSLPFAPGAAWRIDLLDPLVLRPLATSPAVQAAAVRVLGREPVATAAGDTLDTWHVTVDRPAGPDADLWFAAAYPNLLVRLAAADGRALLLRTHVRRAYW